MPTNLCASLKPLVRLKPSESCLALKRHFEEGVMREVVGAWEAQLHKYPNDKNFLWVNVPWTVTHTVKGHNKKASFKDRVSYSRNMVGRAYLVAREMGIVSRPMNMEIDGVIRRGFVLTPHDALCKRTEKGCLWCGPHKILGTSWRLEMILKDEKPTGKKSIIFKGFLEPAGHQQGHHEGHDKGHQQGHDMGHHEGHQNHVESGSPLGSPIETPKTVEPVNDSQNSEETRHSVSESGADLYLPSQLVSTNREDREDRLPPRTGEPSSLSSLPNSLTKTVDRGVLGKGTQPESEIEQAEKKPSIQTEAPAGTQETNHLLVDQIVLAPPPASAAPPPVLTIAEHFEHAEIAACWTLRYLQVATDDLLTLTTPVNGYSERQLREAYREADNAIREAVEKIGHTRMNGRKSLGEVLDLAINTGGKKLPKPVFKVLKELKASGGETNLMAVKPKPRPAHDIEFRAYEFYAGQAGAGWPDDLAAALHRDGLPKAESMLEVWRHLENWYGLEVAMPDVVKKTYECAKTRWAEFKKNNPKMAEEQEASFNKSR